MNREQCLKSAADCVLQNRADMHGAPEDSFRLIARLWNEYLAAKFRANPEGVCIAPHDVASMMVLLKLARIAVTPTHSDSWVDIAGYAACGVECSTVDDA